MWSEPANEGKEVETRMISKGIFGGLCTHTVMIFFLSGRLCSSENFLLPSVAAFGISAWERMVDVVIVLAHRQAPPVV